jgi:hypothetical protein
MAAASARNYDLVTVVYVVNVLPSPEERLAAVRAAASFARAEACAVAAGRKQQLPQKPKGWVEHVQ